jgi:hypothetical protein
MSDPFGRFGLDFSRRITIRHASKICGYTPRRLTQLIESGELPAQHDGARRWTVTLNQVLICLQRRILSGKSRKKKFLASLDQECSAWGSVRREFFQRIAEI